MSTLSTGLVTFTVPFDNGDTGAISFRPNDRNLQERIGAFEQHVSEKAEELCKRKFEGVAKESSILSLPDARQLSELPPSELVKARAALEAVLELDKAYNEVIKEELDRVFDSKISEVAFRYCEPFDIVLVTNSDGSAERKPYIVNFLEWLTEEIAELNNANKKAMDKHLAKYRK